MFKKKNEKNKTLYKHYLACSKCSFKFSIESEESNNAKIEVDKMKCPVCSKAIQIDPAMLSVSGKPSTETQARMNVEASREAQRMAIERKRMDVESGENEEVSVTSYQEGKGKGGTERLPKKVVESIKEKIAPILEE